MMYDDQVVYLMSVSNVGRSLFDKHVQALDLVVYLLFVDIEIVLKCMSNYY